VVLAVLGIGVTVSATTYEVSPDDDLFGILGSLAAGDEVVVAAGSYSSQQTGGSWYRAVTWSGTASMPIVIRAADGVRPVLEGDPAGSQNLLNIDGSHFVLRGFELVGGSHALRLGNVDHSVLEDLVIHDIHDVAISCNRPGHLCSALTVRGCEIFDTGLSGTGEGMYIGCNDAGCTVSESLFEYNYIHDLGGSQGDGIEIKTGSWGNIVRGNVIVNARYPAITMYGFADGLGPRNLVEGNFVWGTIDNGIQVVGQIVVRNNIVVDAGVYGIHSKPSQGFEPHDLEIVHNTVYNAGAACMKTNDWGSLPGQVLANNAFYCPGGTAVNMVSGPTGATLVGNITLGSVIAPGGMSPGNGAIADLGDPDNLVFYPPDGSALVGAASVQHKAADDFNVTPRSDPAPDAGAYERTGPSNPGWPPAAGFKPRVVPLFADGFETGDTSAWTAG